MAPEDFDFPAAVRQELQQLANRYAVSYPVLCLVYRLGASTARVVGPTGAFPFGRLGPDDEGELAVAIAADVAHGVIRIEFGTPVAHVSLPAAHAEQLAAALVEYATQIRAGVM
ncbi:MAG: hypothetical protein ABJA98_01595 [Acidobacteriota bacterium]